MRIPFHRPDLGEQEIEEVVNSLRSGWLTTGPRVRELEEAFAAAVGADHAVAVNSGTAALHLAVEALGLKAGQAVLVPTMTFAATAEVVRYQGGIPILVDCDPVTTNIDPMDVVKKLDQLRSNHLPADLPEGLQIVGMIPVHVGGLMADLPVLQELCRRHRWWMVEDAAHAFPAALRSSPAGDWKRCGENTSATSCFSFYANKTMTTGEGGMAVTSDPELAERIRLMSLHGLSRDSWSRYSGGGWDYRIVAPGFKYNLTDIAAAIGIQQLKRAEAMRLNRERLALQYLQGLEDLEELQLPPQNVNRIHAWHLFPIKLRLQHLSVDRDQFFQALKEEGVDCSVHWRPLHLHPYYQETFGWRPESFPTATKVWEQLISLPLYPTMTNSEMDYVLKILRRLCCRYASGRRLTSRNNARTVAKAGYPTSG